MIKLTGRKPTLNLGGVESLHSMKLIKGKSVPAIVFYCPGRDFEMGRKFLFGEEDGHFPILRLAYSRRNH
jgi:hypothetical protein